MTPRDGATRQYLMQVYGVHPRKDKRGFDLISDALPFGRLWYCEPDAANNAIGYAKFYSRSHNAVIRIYDAAGNVIETHEHAGDFRQFCALVSERHPMNCIRLSAIVGNPYDRQNNLRFGTELPKSLVMLLHCKSAANRCLPTVSENFDPLGTRLAAIGKEPLIPRCGLCFFA